MQSGGYRPVYRAVYKHYRGAETLEDVSYRPVYRAVYMPLRMGMVKGSGLVIALYIGLSTT